MHSMSVTYCRNKCMHKSLYSYMFHSECISLHGNKIEEYNVVDFSSLIDSDRF